MSINKKQFELLQAMGITVWQRRKLSSHNLLSPNATEIAQNDATNSDSSTAVTSPALSQSSPDTIKKIVQTAESDCLAVDLKSLLKQPLFKDIIRCLGANSADLSISHNKIDLGIINWQFTPNERIEFKHNCLSTPDLTTLANSPELKKSLWQSIGSLSST
ncbi:DNA polymerase III subunit psi [Colwellia sp. MB02u-6]|uniref:DNA polymerase III subunit psi n=1 Tax=Colwellia sp. MB02u-6 TaxID=2759824 RepID=UPI0015F77B09|nr:DNA polymerase III subunit psi [Colwellia sp. MB02u-6]MBA6327921.1 DNA polymerase III subunit psi [Colwellia sp. MB02u-6]